MKEYYKILSLQRGCNDHEIKASYRRLAQIWHPDKNVSSNAHEKFIEIHEAYEILIDPHKRKLYDNLYFNNGVIIIKKATQEEKTTYEQYAKDAHSKAEYFSKISFDKYASIFLNGIGKAFNGCSYIFITGWAIFFVFMGFYGITMLIKTLIELEVFVLWRIVLGSFLFITFSALFFYAAYRIFKKVAKDMS